MIHSVSLDFSKNYESFSLAIQTYKLKIKLIQKSFLLDSFSLQVKEWLKWLKWQGFISEYYLPTLLEIDVLSFGQCHGSVSQDFVQASMQSPSLSVSLCLPPLPLLFLSVPSLLSQNICQNSIQHNVSQQHTKERGRGRRKQNYIEEEAEL